MAEQVVADSQDKAWYETLFEKGGALLEKGANGLLEIELLERFPGDNATANPETAHVVTTGVQPTGQPFTLGGAVADYWPMVIAALVVLGVLAVLVAQVFS